MVLVMRPSSLAPGKQLLASSPGWGARRTLTPTVRPPRRTTWIWKWIEIESSQRLQVPQLFSPPRLAILMGELEGRCSLPSLVRSRSTCGTLLETDLGRMVVVIRMGIVKIMVAKTTLICLLVRTNQGETEVDQAHALILHSSAGTSSLQGTQRRDLGTSAWTCDVSMWCDVRWCYCDYLQMHKMIKIFANAQWSNEIKPPPLLIINARSGGSEGLVDLLDCRRHVRAVEHQITEICNLLFESYRCNFFFCNLSPDS